MVNSGSRRCVQLEFWEFYYLWMSAFQHAIATWIATSASFDFKTSAELNYVIQTVSIKYINHLLFTELLLTQPAVL